MNWTSLVTSIILWACVLVLFGLGFLTGFSWGKHRGIKEALKVLEPMQLKETISNLIKLLEIAKGLVDTLKRKASE